MSPLGTEPIGNNPLGSSSDAGVPVDATTVIEVREDVDTILVAEDVTTILVGAEFV